MFLSGEKISGTEPRAGYFSRSEARPRLLQHISQDPADLLELLRPGDQRRGELDDGVAAVVGAAVEARVEQRLRQEPAQQPLRLLVVERLLGLLVLDQLDAVEVAGAADVAHDGQVAQ